MNWSKEFKKKIESKILECGFPVFGWTPADIPPEDRKNLELWVEKGLYGKMDWFPARQGIRLEFENLGFPVKSVLVLAAPYNHPDTEEFLESLPFRFSRYAVGKDYHSVLKEKAKPLLEFLRISFPKYRFRMGVDSLPISEKVLAKEAGIGWRGKHTNVIHPQLGSYFFLACILTDLPLLEEAESDRIPDHCGSCTACIDSCPTNALRPYQIDASLCISHTTIEDRSSPKVETHGWVYGCDICQEVCPWNQRAAKLKSFTEWEEFLPTESMRRQNEIGWQEMDEDRFVLLFRDSAVDRISYRVWKRNEEASHRA